MGVAVKVTEVPWQMLFCEGFRTTEGTTAEVLTIIVIELLNAVSTDAQGELLIILTFTESLLFREELL